MKLNFTLSSLALLFLISLAAAQNERRQPIPRFFTDEDTSFKFGQQCRHRCVRKSAKDYTSNNWLLYQNLWRTANDWGYITAISREHNYDCADDRRGGSDGCLYHFVPALLPWHRLFTAHFEQILQQIDEEIYPGRAQDEGPFCLPYSNWGYGDTFFDNDPRKYTDFFGPDKLGTLREGRIPDGNFRNLQVDGDPVLRSPEVQSNQWSNSVIAGCLNNSNIECNDDADCGFRPCLEYSAHGAWHSALGATMVSLNSPRDPAFFLHHAMIDFLFEKYLEIQGTNVPDDYDEVVPRPYNANGNRIWFTDTFDTERLCYTYAQPGDGPRDPPNKSLEPNAPPLAPAPQALPPVVPPVKAPEPQPAPPPPPKVPEPKVPEPKAPEPKVPEPKVPEPKAPEPKVPEPKVPEPKAPEPKVPEPKAPEPKVPEPKAPEPKAPEPKVPEPKVPEPKAPEPKNPQPKEPEPKNPPPKEPEPKNPPPKEPEPKAPEPKNPPSKEPEPKNPPPKEPEPKNPPSKEPEPKAPPSKEPEPKNPPSKEPEPKNPPSKAPEPKTPSAPPKAPQPTSYPIDDLNLSGYKFTPSLDLKSNVSKAGDIPVPLTEHLSNKQYGAIKQIINTPLTQPMKLEKCNFLFMMKNPNKRRKIYKEYLKGVDKAQKIQLAIKRAYNVEKYKEATQSHIAQGTQAKFVTFPVSRTNTYRIASVCNDTLKYYK